MNELFNDDRTEEQRASHRVIVAMNDSFMSGWGKAEGRTSVAAWAHKYEHDPEVYKWVDNRSDAKYVRYTSIAALKAASRRGSHVHIYVVEDAHPSLDRLHGRMVQS